MMFHNLKTGQSDMCTACVERQIPSRIEAAFLSTGLSIYESQKIISFNLLRLCLPSSRSSGNDYSSSIVSEAWPVPQWHRSTQRSVQPSPWWSSLSGPQEGWAGTRLLVRRKTFQIIAGEIMALWHGLSATWVTSRQFKLSQVDPC